MTRHTNPPTHCLNCREPLTGRYCSKCGQDSQEHMDSVWHLFKHFFEDITHYDGKLWNTVRPLLTRPGFLTQQFLQGKRASYLNPVRMFIFFNFVFFLLIIELPGSGSQSGKGHPTVISTGAIAQDSVKQQLHDADSIMNQELNLDKMVTIRSSDNYTSFSQYDSAQQALPPDKRDGRFNRLIAEKWIPFSQLLKRDPNAVEERANEIFLHNSAKLTFVFIIICSCLLYLLYFRKHANMVDHALFSVHLGCTFLLLSVGMLLFRYIPHAGYIALALFLYGNYYFFRALRVVYGQSFSKTALKYCIINFFLLISMSLALVINAVFTLLSIRN